MFYVYVLKSPVHGQGILKKRMKRSMDLGEFRIGGGSSALKSP